jgi:hypothetical protein
MLEISREFRQQSDLDVGPILPFDEVFAAYDPSAHLTDDFFQNKLAFVVLLNFPLTTLEERLRDGERWSRRQWAEARLAQMFSKRVRSVSFHRSCVCFPTGTCATRSRLTTVMQRMVWQSSG